MKYLDFISVFKRNPQIAGATMSVYLADNQDVAVAGLINARSNQYSMMQMIPQLATHDLSQLVEVATKKPGLITSSSLKSRNRNTTFELNINTRTPSLFLNALLSTTIDSLLHFLKHYPCETCAAFTLGFPTYPSSIHVRHSFPRRSFRHFIQELFQHVVP